MEFYKDDPYGHVDTFTYFVNFPLRKSNLGRLLSGKY